MTSGFSEPELAFRSATEGTLGVAEAPATGFAGQVCREVGRACLPGGVRRRGR